MGRFIILFNDRFVDCIINSVEQGMNFANNIELGSCFSSPVKNASLPISDQNGRADSERRNKRHCIQPPRRISGEYSQGPQHGQDNANRHCRDHKPVGSPDYFLVHSPIKADIGWKVTFRDRMERANRKCR